MDIVFKEKAELTGKSELELLQETLKKYRALVKSSNTGAWEYFPEIGNLDCNSVYFSMLGRDVHHFDVEGQNNLKEVWIDLLHPDDREQAVKIFFDYVSNPEGRYENTFRLQHANGSWVWISSRGGLLQDENDATVYRIIGVHIDVTLQKQAEEEAQRERILLRTLIDNLPDTIYVKDAECRKIIANRADVATIGARSESEVIGKTDLELFPNEIGRRGHENDLEILRTGKPLFNKEEVFYDKDGHQHWLLTSKVPVHDENGNISRILGIGHNITERKRADEALKKLNEELNQQSLELSKQAGELKELNAQLLLQQEQELEKAIAQGKFEIASEVLHDIGNALVGFGSYLTRINRVMDKPGLDAIKNLAVFAKAQESAFAAAIGQQKAAALAAITEGIARTQTANQQEISGSVMELLNIVTHIQEILNIQRQFVRGHGASHDRKPVNLANIIDDCRSMLNASLEKRGVKLTVNVHPGPHIIKGDQTKLMQVILNVLKNSLEAIDHEKEDKAISVNLQSADGQEELKIQDNGQGFDAETSSRFFERGFTTKKSGTGLGLYNCRSIVESHAGTFVLTSDGPGMGATTVIKFAL